MSQRMGIPQSIVDMLKYANQSPTGRVRPGKAPLTPMQEVRKKMHEAELAGEAEVDPCFAENIGHFYDVMVPQLYDHLSEHADAEFSDLFEKVDTRGKLQLTAAFQKHNNGETVTLPAFLDIETRRIVQSVNVEELLVIHALTVFLGALDSNVPERAAQARTRPEALLMYELAARLIPRYYPGVVVPPFPASLSGEVAPPVVTFPESGTVVATEAEAPAYTPDVQSRKDSE